MVFAVASLAVGGLSPRPAVTQAPQGTVLEEMIPPGANFDKAEFKFWLPKGAGAVRAVLVLVPGSNGDGRPMADDTVWQAFAAKHKLALVACRFTDKPHDQGFIEEYIKVSEGTGDALLKALATFGSRSGHAEIATAPLLMWGMSAGGQFNYEFVAWKPERVMAFVVNKGGIYYSALLTHAARNVPGMLFVGGKDLEFRTNTITGLFAVNRRGGALWALAEEPSAAHIVGRSRDVALVFYEDMLALRLGSGAALATLTEKSGFLGDLRAKTFEALGDNKVPNYPTAWLPTARVAKAWQAMVTEQPNP
jgi:poly(3-hydroxybutyrate) depolymerase